MRPCSCRPNGVCNIPVTDKKGFGGLEASGMPATVDVTGDVPGGTGSRCGAKGQQEEDGIAQLKGFGDGHAHKLFLVAVEVR